MNAGFLVGHCALRRYVLGEDFMRESTPDELEQLAGPPAQLAGRPAASGLSTTRSSTHVDGNGDPVPSRFASEEEVLELCEVVGEFEGTCLEVIVQGCLEPLQRRGGGAAWPG